MSNNNLSLEAVKSLGFQPVDWKDICDGKYPFVDMSEMPFLAKDSVMLLYNDGHPFPLDAFLLAYCDMRCGNYHLATIRWVRTVKEVCEAYKALTGKEISPRITFYSNTRNKYIVGDTLTTRRKYRIRKGKGLESPFIVHVKEEGRFKEFGGSDSQAGAEDLCNLHYSQSK